MKTTYHGEWYSPKYPEVRLQGILEIEDDAIELKLYSPVDFRGEPLNGDGDRISMYSTILGDCQLGKLVTLLDCEWTHSNPISDSFGIFSLRPQIVFEGQHYKNRDEIMFNSISCSYSYLSAWIEDCRTGSDLDKFDEPFSDFDSRFNKTVSIDVGEGFTIRIVQFLRKKGFSIQRKVSFQIHHVVNIVSLEPRVFNVFEMKAHHFRRLLQIGMDTNIRAEFHEGYTHDARISIYHPHNKLNKGINSDSPLSQGKMLFSYYKLSETDFKTVIRKWFDTIDKYGVIYDFYTDSNQWFKGTGAYLTSVMFNNRILNMMQGLESFHTLSDVDELESEDAFETKFQEVISGLSELHVNWLRERTRRLSKSLRTRLRELVNKFGSIFDMLLVTSREKKDFVDDLVEYRNRLSHGRHTTSDIEIEIEELYLKAKILLLACILHNLGLKDVTIKKMIRESFDRGNELRFCEYRRQLRISKNNLSKRQ